MLNLVSHILPSIGMSYPTTLEKIKSTSPLVSDSQSLGADRLLGNSSNTALCLLWCGLRPGVCDYCSNDQMLCMTNTLTIWNAISCYPKWLSVSWAQWFSKKLLFCFKPRWQDRRIISYQVIATFAISRIAWPRHPVKLLQKHAILGRKLLLFPKVGYLSRMYHQK